LTAAELRAVSTVQALNDLVMLESAK